MKAFGKAASLGMAEGCDQGMGNTKKLFLDLREMEADGDENGVRWAALTAPLRRAERKLVY